MEEYYLTAEFNNKKLQFSNVINNNYPGVTYTYYTFKPH